MAALADPWRPERRAGQRKFDEMRVPETHMSRLDSIIDFRGTPAHPFSSWNNIEEKTVPGDRFEMTVPTFP